MLKDGNTVRSFAEIWELLVRSDVAVYESFVGFKDSVRKAFLKCAIRVIFSLQTSTQKIRIKEEQKIVLGFALPKDSEFQGLFNHHLGKMEVSGVIDRMKREWLDPKPNKDFSSGGEAVALNYKNLIFPFCILIIGVIVSVFVIASERLMKPVSFLKSCQLSTQEN